MLLIYKIVPDSLWQTAEATGTFDGAPVDLADGFIHFSTATQALETAAKHFAGQADLLLVAIDPDRLGSDLKWEVSRGGALFPHLYASLQTATALWVRLCLLRPPGTMISRDCCHDERRLGLGPPHSAESRPRDGP